MENRRRFGKGQGRLTDFWRKSELIQTKTAVLEDKEEAREEKRLRRGNLYTGTNEQANTKPATGPGFHQNIMPHSSSRPASSHPPRDGLQICTWLHRLVLVGCRQRHRMQPMSRTFPFPPFLSDPSPSFPFPFSLTHEVGRGRRTSAPSIRHFPPEISRFAFI